MTFLLISFLAGCLTVLAPCILPLLPVVVGSAASGRSRSTKYVVVLSLGLSVIAFTFLLKVSSIFISIPQEFWSVISGLILGVFGLTLIFPSLWESIPGMARVAAGSNKIVGSGYTQGSVWGDVLVGAGLGPVFSTCSPTYFVILASVLPANFALGTLYILAYVIGLSIMLLLVAFLGEALTARLASASDSHGIFKRLLGVLFLGLGIAVMTGYDKVLEAKILNSGVFDVTQVERTLLEYGSTPKNAPMPKNDISQNTPQQNSAPNEISSSSTAPTSTSPASASTAISKAAAQKIKPRDGIPYVEIANPAGFVNTPSTSSGQATGIKIKDLIGKKVVLLDFMTYSCINCQRTFPYLVAWYKKYQDQGLEIVGIHTPEFAFEKNKSNVEEAMKKFGITYPVVLDNDYGTWNAYGNVYWPRKYLIDIHGNIVYDHPGEGQYAETEKVIQDLLAERAQVLGEKMTSDSSIAAEAIPEIKHSVLSPETYFGSMRNEFLANGTPGTEGAHTFSLPMRFDANALYLNGQWTITPEYAESGESSSVVYEYLAKEVYLVMDAETSTDVEVWQDGRMVSGEAGADVQNGVVKVHESRLYKLIKNSMPGIHTLELKIKGKGVHMYAFTFG